MRLVSNVLQDPVGPKYFVLSYDHGSPMRHHSLLLVTNGSEDYTLRCLLYGIFNLLCCDDKQVGVSEIEQTVHTLNRSKVLQTHQPREYTICLMVYNRSVPGHVDGQYHLLLAACTEAFSLPLI
jgi:hypothetical protein